MHPDARLLVCERAALAFWLRLWSVKEKEPDVVIVALIFQGVRRPSLKCLKSNSDGGGALLRSAVATAHQRTAVIDWASSKLSGWGERSRWQPVMYLWTWAVGKRSKSIKQLAGHAGNRIQGHIGRRYGDDLLWLRAMMEGTRGRRSPDPLTLSSSEAVDQCESHAAHFRSFLSFFI